jgi:hypothetical protein
MSSAQRDHRDDDARQEWADRDRIWDAQSRRTDGDDLEPRGQADAEAAYEQALVDRESARAAVEMFEEDVLDMLAEARQRRREAAAVDRDQSTIRRNQVPGDRG